MDHLLTVAALLAIATFVTGVVLPLTTRDRNGAASRDPSTEHDEIAAAQLAARG